MEFVNRTVRGQHRKRNRAICAGAACAYCGEPATEVDHVVPLRRGGVDEESNLVPACKPCNLGKVVHDNFWYRLLDTRAEGE